MEYKTLNAASSYKDQVQNAKDKIKNLKVSIQETSERSELLDQDIMDLITLELQLKEILKVKGLGEKALIDRLAKKGKVFNMTEEKK